MSKSKKIFDISLITLACLSLLFICFFFYYKANYKDISLETNYLGNGIGTGTIAEELEEAGLDNPPMIEFQLFSADSGVGEYLSEMKISFFSDYLASPNGIYQAGVQTVDKNNSVMPTEIGFWEDLTNNRWASDVNNTIYSRFSYYDAYSKDDVTNGSWKSMEGLKTLTYDEILSFVITMEGKPYLLKMDKGYKVDVKYFLGTWKTYAAHYSFYDLFYYLQDVVKSFSKGYGEYVIPVDLSEFFTVYSYNESTARFNDEQDARYIIEKIYVPVKFHYHNNGYTDPSQSLFESVKYTQEDVDFDNIWKIQQIYDVGPSNYTLQYSELYEGYLLSFNTTDLKNIDLDKVKLRAIINLSDFDENIVGLNYLCFNGIPIDYLEINADSYQEFYFLNKSLTNTELKSIESRNINSIFIEGSKDFGGAT